MREFAVVMLLVRCVVRVVTVADGVILESETKLATPAVYMPVHASHTMILYHPTTLMATTGFLNDPKAYFHAAS